MSVRPVEEQAHAALDRELSKALVGERHWKYGRCMFCGGYTFGRVCRAHIDLVQLLHTHDQEQPRAK